MEERSGARRAEDATRAFLAEPAHRFVAAVVLAGAAALAALALTGEFAVLGHPSARLALFMALTAAGELWLLRLPTYSNWTVISASSLFTLGTIIVFGAGPALVALVAGSLLKDLRDRRPAVKVVFNATQYALSVAAAGAAYDALGRHGAFSPAQLPPALLSGAVFLVVNAVLTSTVVALAARDRLLAQLRRNFDSWMMIEGVSLGFAPVVVASTERTLWLLPLLALPFLAVRQGARIAMRSEHAAMHDALTGLPNRALFGLKVAQAVEHCAHSGGEVVVMMLDLDRFKEVNDTLGHGRGDELLRGIAERLARALRDVDVVARLGGDEFGVLVTMPGPDVDATVALADRIRDALEPPFALGDLWVDAGASVGIASSSLHGGDAETLVQRADVAMYLAKEGGAGHELYDPARDPNAPERLALVRDLRRGIQSDELVLHYQPKIDVATGALTGVEALVRWDHPERGLLAPAEFIELAERTDAVRALTLRVVERALRQAAAWRDAGHPTRVAVNLSPRVLLDVALPADIERLLDEAGVEHSLLEVELTESSLIADPERTASILRRLARAGVRITIDDFGTGYSSLVVLRRMPVDGIKVDRSFVAGMERSAEDAAIVASTVGLADSLGLAVVAEGVETAEALERLRQMGCGEAQGFHICRPAPAEALEPWLRARRWTALAG